MPIEDQPNFLLGHGERLVEPVTIQSGGGPRKLPYSFAQARERLAPQVDAASHSLDALPDSACPNDEVVGIITLHPQWLAKSYHPTALLREVGLETVGSRPRMVKPEKWTKKGEVEEAPSTELFVAGPRDAFRDWATTLPGWSPATDVLRKELARLEAVRAPERKDRVQKIRSREQELVLEVGLHGGRGESGLYILDAFQRFVEGLGMEAVHAKKLFAGRLCFMPVLGERSRLSELWKFSYLRVVREMPRLRRLDSVLRSVSVPAPGPVILPDADPVDPGLRVAVLDGGTPKGAGLERWVTPYDAKGVGGDVPKYLSHGAHVNSAVLFGALSAEEGAQPYAAVDHFRVLDSDSGKDDELYDVMHRVRDVMQSNNHSFFNLSIGPELPVEDTEVHAWTCMLDELLADGNRLAAVAVGNGGDLDSQAGHNRVQVPADGVNALSVGSADTQGAKWRRAWYSSVGPGRSPGLIKPDVLSFGGIEQEPFWVVDSNSPAKLYGALGTSFASPAALRHALGIRAHFRESLNHLAIRALLVHCAEDADGDRLQHGWGRLPDELDSYVVCPDGSARIVYQGEVEPGGWVRAPIPLPDGDLPGNVRIRATFCYATRIDPNHPGNYTQSGLVITFRPNDAVFDEKSEHPEQPKSKSFFKRGEYQTERELRQDALKWETVIHADQTKRGRGLKNPVFDVNYQVREEGQTVAHDRALKYALVITVSSKRIHDMYNRVLRRYQSQLQPLRPVVKIPVRTRM